MRPGGRWVHPGSMGSVMCAMVVVGIIMDCWIRSRALWGWLGSSGVVAITGVRPGDRWVRPGSLGSLARSIGVVGFIRGCWVHSRAV